MNGSENSDREQQQESPQPVSLLRTRPARIVLYDREPCVLDAIAMLVKIAFSDITLIECATVDDCLLKIEREAPDLLISDYNGPGSPSEEMFERLRLLPARFPIIVCSAYEGSKNLESIPGLTISNLYKPFLLKDLKRLGKDALIRDLPNRDSS